MSPFADVGLGDADFVCFGLLLDLPELELEVSW